jgi:hypothetical protein
MNQIVLDPRWKARAPALCQTEQMALLFQAFFGQWRGSSEAVDTFSFLDLRTNRDGSEEPFDSIKYAYVSRISQPAICILPTSTQHSTAR